jgi:hypothetical protein
VKRTESGRNPSSPVVAPGATGIVVAATFGDAGLFVHGAYRLLAADVERLGVPIAQRAVVVAAQSGTRVDAFNAWGDQLVFPDDEDRGPSTVEGFFHVDLGSRFPLAAGETCHVVVSMGAVRSNVIAFSMPKGTT